MNSKDIKKYKLLSEILASGQGVENIVDKVVELAALDFAVAFEVWEYVLGMRQNRLADFDFAALLEGKCFETFHGLSEAKTRALFVESLPLNKLVYTMSASCCTGTNLQFLANLILSSKTEAAEEALRCVRANNVAKTDFGDRMKIILDRVFETYCTRNNVRKPELSRKQANMLLDYISKIKGPNKKLLTQRIKEL